MKKFILLFLFFIISSLYGNGNEKIYKAIVLDNWKPYYFLDENNKPTGFAIDLFEEIIKESNVKVEYIIRHNATELIQAFENKEVDLMPNLGYSVKRKDILDYSSFSDTSRLLLYKRVKSDNIKSINDIKKVAVVSYNVGEKIVKKRFPSLKTIVFSDHFSALRALLSGEVDAFVYPEPIMEYTLNELNLDDKITSFGKSLSETKRDRKSVV